MSLIDLVVPVNHSVLTLPDMKHIFKINLRKYFRFSDRNLKINLIFY